MRKLIVVGIVALGFIGVIGTSSAAAQTQKPTVRTVAAKTTATAKPAAQTSFRVNLPAKCERTLEAVDAFRDTKSGVITVLASCGAETDPQVTKQVTLPRSAIELIIYVGGKPIRQVTIENAPVD